MKNVPPDRRMVYTKSFALIIGVCFMVELLTMQFLGAIGPYDPVWAGLFDAALLSLAILGCLYFWVFPSLMRENRERLDQAELTKTLINAIPAPIFYKNEHGIYTGCNAHFEAYLGRRPDEIVGQSVYGLSPPELAKVYEKADRDLMDQGGAQVYETSVVHADGSEHDVMFHKAVYNKSNGDVGGIIGVILDISERKELERKLQALASLDDLTQLPNRRELDNNLNQALARTARSDSPLALLFIDMDGFKVVNDDFGHEAGDEVLKLIAERIKGLLRKSDIAGRMGGDEFAVILEGNINLESTTLVAEKLLKALAAPYEVPANGSGKTRTAHISASIGIAFAPQDGADLKTLLANADASMYAAKAQGKNRFVLTSDDT